MTDDDDTPVDRPVGVANIAYRGLVRVLTNHISMLDQVRTNIEAIRDALQAATIPPDAGQLERLAREFRREADSAVDVAREAEALAKRARTGEAV